MAASGTMYEDLVNTLGDDINASLEVGGDDALTHGLGSALHSSSTLAALNAKISDATLDTNTAQRTPLGTGMAALTAKGAPVSGDILVIADSEAANVSKKITIGDLPSGGIAQSYSRVTGANGYGSTNTHIWRWGSEVDSAGTDVTYTDDAADGGYWTCTTAGIYSVSVTVEINTTSIAVTYSLNTASALSNTYEGADTRIMVDADVDDVPTTGTWIGHVAAGDKIWVMTNGAVGDTVRKVSTTRNQVTVCRLV